MWFLLGALVATAVVIKFIHGLHALNRPTPRPVDDVEQWVERWEDDYG